MTKRKRFGKDLAKKVVALGSVLTLSSGAALWSHAETVPVTKTDTTGLNAGSVRETVGNSEKTNIIYITLDDIGYSDLGAYGSEIKTPNIDKLAAEGLRYTNFQACPFSSATRASLLSGREHNSVGMGHVASVSLADERRNVQGLVRDEAGLVSEILGENDYSSYAIGKWHIAPTHTVTPAGPFDYWPLGKGFDRFYGFMDGETDQYRPQLVSGNEFLQAFDAEDYILNDDMVERAMTFITDHVSVYPEKAFFMNYAFGTGHSPQQVPESYIEMYEGKYDVGWDAIRLARFEKQKTLGVVPMDAQLPDSDETVKSWASLSADEKKVYTRFMETYAGYITQADEEIGKLIDHLKAVGEYDNTLIVLIGDNGASPDGGSDGSDNFIGSMSGAYQPTAELLMPKYNLIGTEHFQALYPKGWAQVSNTPFAGYKGGTELGALRNPMIVSWPAGITDGGGIRDQYIHVADITPTVLDAVHAEIPSVIDGVEQMPFYGTSFLSTFENKDAKEIRNEAIYYISGDRSMYADGWRAVGKFNKQTLELTWSLYHPAEDYTESTELSAVYPEKLEELKALFIKRGEDIDILPLINVTVRDMAYVKSGTAADRKSFKYYSGLSGILNLKAAPAVETNSYSITVPLTYTAGDEGVLAAMGDIVGGHTLYVLDGKPVFQYNRYQEYFTVESSVKLVEGENIIKFEFERTSMGTGHGKLYVNGVLSGESDIRTAILVTLEGLSIGSDLYHPVSPVYADKGTFPYSGEFEYVQYDMKPFIPTGNGHGH